MNIVQVAQVLTPAGLCAPHLAALLPNVNNYTVLLAQPQGSITADAAGVRNRDHARAEIVFTQFIDKAVETNADLAVTPEYSLPWATLVASLKAGRQPLDGKLWVFGCESITRAELAARQAELDDIATVLFEPLEPLPNRFLDPLVYVFRTEAVDGGPTRLVLLVQFKTHPMGDSYEIEHLHRGTNVYQFGDIATTLRLISLICSDAFAFSEGQAAAIYQRALVLHIQLNEKPRQHQYRQYRERLFYYQGDETELLCLNWAHGVCEWSNGQEKAWKNPSASAWYLRPKDFDSRDHVLCANHARGLYYTWLETSRAHVLFLNYSAGAYLVEATKVAHTGVPASASRRVGPKLQRVFIWDPKTAVLIEQDGAADGFSTIVEECGLPKDAIWQVYEASPIAVERMLALCAGRIGVGPWYKVGSLDSFAIATTEIVRRITFCQDEAQEAREFRSARLMRCRNLLQIISDANNLPPALKDLADGFKLAWHDSHPHQNVRTNADARATAIYLGEDVDDATIDAVVKIIAENLRCDAANDNEANIARQRLVVWYRRDGQLCLHDKDRYVHFDEPRNSSEFDITRSK